MNSSQLNLKKKRRSSSKFSIANKQAKLINSRKCRRVNLLDKNRHININDLSTNEEPIAVKIEQLELGEPAKQDTETIKTMAPISKLNELKTKFNNFKNSLVKSISNIKKPPSGTQFNQVKKEKVQSTSQLPVLQRQTSRKVMHPLNDFNIKTINDQHRRLQGNTLVRSSSVSTIKMNINKVETDNDTKLNIVKQMRKFDSSTSCRSFNYKENKPSFNQYAKITYNDKHLFQPSSVNLN